MCRTPARRAAASAFAWSSTWSCAAGVSRKTRSTAGEGGVERLGFGEVRRPRCRFPECGSARRPRGRARAPGPARPRPRAAERLPARPFPWRPSRGSRCITSIASEAHGFFRNHFTDPEGRPAQGMSRTLPVVRAALQGPVRLGRLRERKLPPDPQLEPALPDPGRAPRRRARAAPRGSRCSGTAWAASGRASRAATAPADRTARPARSTGRRAPSCRAARGTRGSSRTSSGRPSRRRPATPAPPVIRLTSATKSCLRVVDRSRRRPPRARAPPSPRVETVPMTRAPRIFAIWVSSSPTPPAAACTRHVSPGLSGYRSRAR